MAERVTIEFFWDYLLFGWGLASLKRSKGNSQKYTYIRVGCHKGSVWLGWGLASLKRSKGSSQKYIYIRVGCHKRYECFVCSSVKFKDYLQNFAHENLSDIAFQNNLKSPFW